MKTRTRKLVALSALTLAAAPFLAPPAGAAEEWPQWRGPRGDATVREAPGLDKWPAGGPKQVWAQPVGLGYASPIGFGGKVYVFALDGSKETLTALDAATGKPAWSQSYDVGRRIDYQGARATPTISGDQIFTYGSNGMLVCRALADGTEAWRLDVLKETGAEMLGTGVGGPWGQASSPLVTADRVFVQGGKGGAVAVAVDRKTGKFAWKSEAQGTGGYAAPIVADVQGTPQLIVFGGDALYGMDPATGKTIWQDAWKTAYEVNAATPIYHNGQLFVTSGYVNQRTGRSALYHLTPTGAKQVWRKEGRQGGIASKFQPPILDAGHVYGVSDEGRGGVLKCQAWATGELKWEAKEPSLGFGGSIVRIGTDKLLAMSQKGELYLLLATPQKVEVMGKAEVFPGGYDQVWATPLVYQGKVYAKGKDQLVCLDLGGK